ncbi:GNAT family N-acetyltransferase [Devosia sp.]|uniref:GNAT family N-acetyltransferase n=1 Tax=Devosia sp. TaxID=1871048 RepID=UPI002EE3B1B9
MIEDHPVEREHHAAHGGRYFVRLPDGSEAELNYRHLDPKTVIAEHTGVPPQYRNHGIALQLVEALIADARAEGFKILPQCGYVAAQFRRHPGWSELRA